MHVIQRLVLLMVAAAALPASASAAQPIPRAFAGLPPITFRYYDVHGETQETIFASVRAAALGTDPDAPTSALTQWSPRFSWDTTTGPGGCFTRSPRVDMEVIVTLPRLANADKASPQALAAWKAYMAVIERHEAGHARIAFAHADDFAREALGARCEQMRPIGQRIIDRITALQEDYERRTQHGRAQGDIVE